MDGVLTRIDKCCQKLPSDTAVSSTTNPRPLKRLLVHTQRGLELCRQCLGWYTERRQPPSRWSEWKSAEAQESEPWLTHAAEHWRAQSMRLIMLLVDYWRELSQVYVDYSPLAMDRQRQFRASELLYVLRLSMDLCRFASQPEPEQIHESALMPRQLERVRLYSLALFDVPVCQMSCSQLLESTRHFINKSLLLRFHPDLKNYFLLIEQRLARLTLYASSMLSGLDVHDMRLPLAGTELAMASGKLVGLTCIMAVAVHRRFSLAVGMLPRDNTPPPPDEALVELLRKWFLKRSKDMTSRSSSKKLRDRVLQCWLTAGEVELFRYEFPGAEDDTLAILTRNRGTAFQNMLNELDVAPADIIEKQLPAVKHPGQESFPLQMALLELCEHSFEHSCHGGQWFGFCTLEQDLEYQDLQRNPMPHMVQLFNHWQLAYKRRMLIYDSYLHALNQWFLIMYRDFRGQFSAELDKLTRADMHQWAEEIFGASRLPNQPAALRPMELASPLGRFVAP